ncbi:MAG: hypothetical protein CR967_04625 [Proteobacteria bacterium]|nr:MAG: hypothetical protein CR967_04625 [Pseudomonadota bacterium]
MWGTIINGLSTIGSVASNPEFLEGVGTLAKAWGSYEVGRRANKIAKEQLAFDKEQLAKQNERQNQAQAELEGALESVYGTPKKKKKNNDLSLAYEASVL